MYGWDILCGISKASFEILHKISNPYIERYDFYTTLKFSELLDLRAHTRFWNAPLIFKWDAETSHQGNRCWVTCPIWNAVTYGFDLIGVCGAAVVNIMAQTGHEQCENLHIPGTNACREKSSHLTMLRCTQFWLYRNRFRLFMSGHWNGADHWNNFRLTTRGPSEYKDAVLPV